MNRAIPRARRTGLAISAALVLALSWGCATLSPNPAAAADSAQYERAYLEAKLRMAAGDYGTAIGVLSPLREEEDCPPEIFVALAEGHFGMRAEEQHALGWEVINQAIERYPRFIPALRFRSALYRLDRKHAEASADIERALELEPRNATMLEELGRLRFMGRRERVREVGRARALDELIETYTRLVEVQPGSKKVRPLLILAGIYGDNGRHEEAIEAAAQAVELRPQELRGQLALAEAYQRAERPAEALRTYRQALLIDPRNPSVRARVGELVAAEGGAEGLLGFFEELARSFPKLQEIQYAYGEELIKASEWEKSAAHFRQMLDMWPAEGKAKSSLMVSLLMLERKDEGIQIAQEIIESGDADLGVLLGLARMLAAAGKSELAAELCERIAQSEAAEVSVLRRVAEVQIQIGERDRAIETLKRLLERKPDSFVGVAMLGQLYVDAGRFDEAHAHYDAMKERLAPENAASLMVSKADLYRSQGEPDRALQILEEIVGEQGEGPDRGILLMVEIYTSRGEFDAAHRRVDQLLGRSSDEQVSNVLSIKAWVYTRERQYDKAVDVLEGLQAEHPDNLAIIEALAENYGELGEFDKAQGLISAARATLDSTSASGLDRIAARLYRKQGDLDSALRMIEKIVDRNPENVLVLHELGQYYHEAGRIEDAERVLRRAIDMDPNNAESYNALAYFFAEADVQLDEALTLVQHALELEPGAGHILDSLGWVYFQQGEFEKSIQALETALQKMKGAPDPVVLEHLGDAYAQGGLRAKAVGVWEDALKLDPQSKSIPEKLGRPVEP